MKRHVISVTILIVAILCPASVFGQAGTPAMTGAGKATLPAGTTFSGVSLTGLTFSAAIFIPGDGSAKGSFQATLSGTVLGLPRDIEISVEAATGSIDSGTGTIAGTATVDMGDGLPPLTDVPFRLTATTTAMVLVIDTTGFPAANITGGGMTIQ